jgi:quinol monooxygenase YgiN
MDSQKIYLLAELTVLPEFLDDVKGALKQALIPTLQEAGCEGMFETSREGDPHKLVFFEIFSSSAAHKFHLEQDYTKRLFTTLEGKKAATALDRYGHVDEIAAMVAFVAGPESSYITGANLTVDGGMNA